MSDLALQTLPQSIGTSAYLDLALSPSGDLQLTSGVQSISQAVTMRLNSFSQDYFLAMDDGLNYYDELLIGNQGLTSAFEAAMQNCVLQTPGIVGLLSWTSTYNPSARSLSVNFEASCTGGVVAFSVPVAISGS